MTGVILCGGHGVRYRNMYIDMPKALAPIGNMPILWHLLKYMHTYGIRRYILCLGARGEEIRDYIDSLDMPQWEVQCVDTGLDTPTGGRIRRIEPYLKDDVFLTTYVDGLADIDIGALTQFAEEAGTTATLTAVRPQSQYGILEFDDQSRVRKFDEKPRMPYYINGGFFIFRKGIFSYLEDDDVLEKDTFHKLIDDNELSAYRHNGFWKSMDTFKENMELNEMWLSGTAEWRKW